MLRRATFALLALALLIVPASASADTELYAGAGPRFSDSGTEAVGAVRLELDLEMMLRFGVQLDGYLTGPESGMDFAGASLQLMFVPPIPGPFSAEIGLVGGVADLIPARHGVDGMPAYLGAEVGVGFAIGPVKTRVAYQHVFESESVRPALTSQLNFLLGFGF